MVNICSLEGTSFHHVCFLVGVYWTQIFRGQQFRIGVYKSQTWDRRGNYIWYSRTWYLKILGMELASCNPSWAKNFEMVPRFLENMCSNGLENVFQNLSLIVLTFTNLTSFREVKVLQRIDCVLIQETLSSLIFAVMYYVICFTFLIDNFKFLS
jgi:hypothetical protein